MTNATRWAIGVTTLLSLLAAVVASVGLAGWVNEDDAITWPADEDSYTPVYPVNHFLYGDTLSIAATALVALAVAGLWVWLRAIRNRPIGGRQAGTHIWFALSVGLTATTTIRYSSALALPFIISAIVALLCAPKSSSNDHHESEKMLTQGLTETK